MRCFYFICDFALLFTKVFMSLWLISQISVSKYWIITERIVQTVVAILLALLNTYNHSLGNSLFSNSMLLITVCLIWLVEIFLYSERKGSCFCLSFIFWSVLALLDFFVQSVSYAILEINNKRSDILLKVGYERGMYLLAFILIVIIICYFIKKPLERGRMRHLYSGVWGKVFVVILGVVGIYFQRIYKLIVSERYMRNWGIFIMLILFTILLFIMFMVKHKEDEVNTIRQLKIDMLESNYQALVQQYQEKSSLLHDEKNHMNAIKELAELGETQKIVSYIGQIYSTLHNAGRREWTQHQMLDLILNMKMQEAAQDHILMDVTCDDMSGLEVDSSDLCSLFTNLLDNAIEANRNRAEGEKCWINLTCKRCNSMLVVKVENPIGEKIKIEDEMLKSSKDDQNFHGFGIYIMQRILDKYDGYMEYEINDDKFCMIQYLVGFKKGRRDEL